MDHVKCKHEEVLDAGDELVDMINNLQDLDDTWNEEAKKINERIKQAAVKNGISNDKFSKYKF
jgi:hypothetical protein